MLLSVVPRPLRLALQSAICILPFACELSSVDYLESGGDGGMGVGGDDGRADDGNSGRGGEGGDAPLPGDDASSDVVAPDTGWADAPPDSTSSRWCDGAATFCADFDVGSLPSGFLTTSGTFLSLTTTNPVSKPNALLLQVPPDGSASGSFGGWLGHGFPNAVTTTMTLSFDILPETLSTTTSGMLFAVVDFIGNASARYSLRLVFTSGQARLEESFLTPPDTYHPLFDVPSNTWSRLSLTVTFSGGAADTATVSIDGTPVGGGAQTLTPEVGVDWHPNLLIGAAFGGDPQTGWVLHYDDVVFDYR
jgi:hypothetical protein